MVYLTMTSAIVAAVQYCFENNLEGFLAATNDHEPAMENPAVGKPISHTQVIALSRCLRDHLKNNINSAPLISDSPLVYHLDPLLRGSRVYIEAPKPKPEPVGYLIL